MSASSITMQTNSTADIIPAGLAEGGRPYNINTLATNAALDPTECANQIADVISSNLLRFHPRPELARLTGLTRCAIAVLRPESSTISTQTPFRHRSMEVNPRGGSFPLIAAVAERFRLVTIDTNAPTATATIESQCFAQMWNPYTAQSSSTTRSFGSLFATECWSASAPPSLPPSMTTIRRSPLVSHDRTKRICRPRISHRDPDLGESRSSE